MDKENINRLKKYLFLISVFFVLLFGGHISYIYLYEGSFETPTQGGTISEGIIGEFPNLNPLILNFDYNKNVIYMLYRGLLKYDYEKNEIVGDLANCNIKDLSYVECYLKDNIFWSNGEEITPGDIIATFNILKNSNINNSKASLLKETTIEERDGVITFSNAVKDINFITVLLQPIVSKNVLDNIGNKELYGNFNPIGGVYSGPYKIDTVSYDDSNGIQKLILLKNEFFTDKEILISKYIYKIFKDNNHLLKHKDTINIFFDKDKTIGNTVPRLDKHNYYLNQYSGLFLNEERLDNLEFRNFILGKIDIDNILKLLGEGYKGISNSFLGKDIYLDFKVKDPNIENIIKEMGYYKKDLLLNEIQKENKEKIENEELEKSNTDLKYILSPVTTKYSFLNEDNVLIKGDTLGENPSAVYFNDYKLSSYKIGDKNFYYRLKTDFKNLNPGENNYKLYFEIAGEKVLKEEFTIIYSSDKDKLKNLENKFNENLKSTQEKTTATGTITQDQKEKVLALDNAFYYDKNLNKLTLRLYYIESKIEFVGVANLIKNTLETYGIGVEALPITIDELNEKILSGEKDYDMIIIGIDLAYFKYNLYPYFHSSQAKNGYNFSNIKNLNLDILLEELKSNILSREEITDIKLKIKDILDEKQVVRPLYQQENTILIDNNIKNFSLGTNITSDLGVIDALLNSYLTGKKDIDFSKKNLQNFIVFIKNIFFND